MQQLLCSLCSLIALLVVQDNFKVQKLVRDDRAVPFERLLSLDECLPADQRTPDMPLEWEARAAIISLAQSTTSGEALDSQICAVISCTSCQHDPWGALQRRDTFHSGDLTPSQVSVAISDCIPLQ